MLELVTATFTLHKVSIESDPEKGIRDLDRGYSLPSHCMAGGYCYQYSVLYVMLAPKTVCPMYLIHSIEMIEMKLIFELKDVFHR